MLHFNRTSIWRNAGTRKLLCLLDEIRLRVGSALDSRTKPVSETWASLLLWFSDGLFCKLQIYMWTQTSRHNRDKSKNYLCEETKIKIVKKRICWPDWLYLVIILHINLSLVNYFFLTNQLSLSYLSWYLYQ